MKRKTYIHKAIIPMLAVAVISGCGATSGAGNTVAPTVASVAETTQEASETAEQVVENTSAPENVTEATMETTTETATEASTETITEATKTTESEATKAPTEVVTETTTAAATQAPTVPPTTEVPTVPPTQAPTVPPTTEAPTVPPTTAAPVTEAPAEKVGIEDVKAWAAIEGDMNLTGTGTGYHAKFVICTAASAVSYGIQYDSCAAAPYTGKAMAMIENVAGNNPGGQAYFRPGNVELQCGQTYHMMMTLNRDGTGSVYIDGVKIGDYNNPKLANQSIVYLRVEGSARKNGDSVNANFSNIKLMANGIYSPRIGWGFHEFKQNPTISSSVTAVGTINVNIAGTVSGIAATDDWDNRYNDVSGIIQFVE